MSTDEISILIDRKLSRLSNTSDKQCIFKVHDYLRRHNERAYEPQVISIGPYHHGKGNLEKMEMYKVQQLKKLLDSRGEENAERYIIALTEVLQQARRCYAEEILLSDNEFVEMMCLDGCFIIEFLRTRPKGTRRWDDSVFRNGWLANGIIRDLLLFENQIPFFILEQLYEMTKIPEEEDDIIQLGLRLCYLMKGYRPKINYATKISAHEISHLLDLVYKGGCASFAATINDPVNHWSLEYIKSTTELQKSGVKIRSATECESWLHITFKDGLIKVPPLIVSDFTESILRNLIVHELSMTNPNSRSYVTDYVKFLDLLIDSPRDVEKLRRHGILVNLLGDWSGDDEAVSTMFNKLLRDINVNNWMFCYSGVFKEVNDYSSSYWNRLRARCLISLDELMKKYFSSPWSIISFLAAGVLLFLTVVQTVFSILAVSNGT